MNNFLLVLSTFLVAASTNAQGGHGHTTGPEAKVCYGFFTVPQLPANYQHLSENKSLGEVVLNLKKDGKPFHLSQSFIRNFVEYFDTKKSTNFLLWKGAEKYDVQIVKPTEIKLQKLKNDFSSFIDSVSRNSLSGVEAKTLLALKRDLIFLSEKFPEVFKATVDVVELTTGWAGQKWAVKKWAQDNPIESVHALLNIYYYGLSRFVNTVSSDISPLKKADLNVWKNYEWIPPHPKEVVKKLRSKMYREEILQLGRLLSVEGYKIIHLVKILTGSPDIARVYDAKIEHLVRINTVDGQLDKAAFSAGLKRYIEAIIEINNSGLSKEEAMELAQAEGLS